MLRHSIFKFCSIFLCGQGMAATEGKENHALLATKEKLYLAKLPESEQENTWSQYDYQEVKSEDEHMNNKLDSIKQDDESKKRKNEKNEKKRNKKMGSKQKKTPFEITGDREAIPHKPDKKKNIKKNKIPFEITGGNEAVPHEFPWIVRLNMDCRQRGMFLSMSAFNCGGSLVSARVVLSAFHCSCNFERQGQHVDYRAVNSVALLGAHNLNDHTYIKKKIIDVKFPPNPAPFVSPTTTKPEFHDFALFVLKEPATFSSKISPICLPNQDQDYSGKTAIAAGWGQTTPGKTMPWTTSSPFLKKVQMTVGGVISTNKITAMSMAGPGHGGCPGDSGGPLMYKNTKGYTLIGTLSTINGTCGETGEASSNKVSDWVDWIYNEMNQLGEKTDGQSCNTNGVGKFGSGGVNDGVDNQDQDGGNGLGNQDRDVGNGLGNQDRDGGNGLGNQDQFGGFWPFGPNQNPRFPF